MKIKPIKNEKDYEQALICIEGLMEIDNPTQDQEDELEVLATLVELYEDDVYPIDLPSPIDAIRFRMEQQGLKQADLVSFIGSKSKVSEVLAGKRSLSLNMIRRLHEGLGIPAEVLLQEKGAKIPYASGIDWLKFPINEMLKQGWIEFEGTLQQAKEHAEELISALAAPVGKEMLQPALFRKSYRDNNCDRYALTAWQIRVCSLAKEEKLPDYTNGTVTMEFARELVKLSYLDDGPLLAKEFLNKSGIHLITVPHLPKTYLDGASIFLAEGKPVIALTLRYDRTDNFWFTLFHELAHVALHQDNDSDDVFFDNLESEAVSELEKDADDWAQQALISNKDWQLSGLDHHSSAKEITEFSHQMRISRAIPAGRIRRETHDYTLHTRLLGNRKVRKLFIEN